MATSWCSSGGSAGLTTRASWPWKQESQKMIRWISILRWPASSRRLFHSFWLRRESTRQSASAVHISGSGPVSGPLDRSSASVNLGGRTQWPASQLAEMEKLNSSNLSRTRPFARTAHCCCSSCGGRRRRRVAQITQRPLATGHRESKFKLKLERGSCPERASSSASGCSSDEGIKLAGQMSHKCPWDEGSRRREPKVQLAVVLASLSLRPKELLHNNCSLGIRRQDPNLEEEKKSETFGRAGRLHSLRWGPSRLLLLRLRLQA